MDKEKILDLKEEKQNSESNMEYLEYGPVLVTSGKQKGRIGYYDDEVENSRGTTLALVYFGDPLLQKSYELISFKLLTNNITTINLVDRINAIKLELFRNRINTRFEIDRLNELIWCTNLLENRYIYAMENINQKMNMRVFISHASQNLDIARALATDLLNDGFSVFLDDWSIDFGENIISRISKEIDECDVLIMIISKDYLNSVNCGDEWSSFYIKYNKIRKDSLYPILIEDAEPPAMIAAIRYFRLKELDLYHKVYSQLLKTLKKRTEVLNERNQMRES